VTVVTELPEASKEYLEGFITQWLRTHEAWQNVGPFTVVVHSEPGQSPNFRCDVSAERPPGSPRDLALMGLLYDLHRRYRLRENGESGSRPASQDSA
jgi:hypothetical protein